VPEDNAVVKHIRKGMGEEGFGADWIERVMRERNREPIEVLVEEELEGQPWERADRSMWGRSVGDTGTGRGSAR
jgi:hypothetical protein